MRSRYGIRGDLTFQSSRLRRTSRLLVSSADSFDSKYRSHSFAEQLSPTTTTRRSGRRPRPRLPFFSTTSTATRMLSWTASSDHRRLGISRAKWSSSRIHGIPIAPALSARLREWAPHILISFGADKMCRRPARTPERGGVDAPAYRPDSLVNSVANIDPDFHPGAFTYLANSLQLVGTSFSEICDANAEVGSPPTIPRPETDPHPPCLRLMPTPNDPMRVNCGKRSRSGSMMHPSYPTLRLSHLPRRKATTARRLPLARRSPHGSTNGSSHPLRHPLHPPTSRAAILPVDSPSQTPSPFA